MKTIFLDADFKCYTSNNSTVKEIIETDIFDGKCDAFVNGYRYIPAGESWTSPEGTIFRGEMVAPWKDFSELDAAQREHEKRLLAEYEAALAEIEAALGV